ncbi:MAG: hypothetical protein ACI4ED_07865 [Suilimivivens sp.]
MPVILMKHKFLLMIILVLLLLSIICQIVMGVIFRNMIREVNNMGTTENKLLKQCKLKFSNCYRLNKGLVNTSVFVDKFIQKMQYGPLLLNRMSHIAGQLMMLSVLVTGITVCLCLASGDTLFQIIPYYLISILGLYLYFSISGIVDIQGQKAILKTDLTDYLENHLMPRLQQEKETARSEEKETHMDEKEQQIPLSSGYQEELENLLKELLV